MLITAFEQSARKRDNFHAQALSSQGKVARSQFCLRTVL